MKAAMKDDLHAGADLIKDIFSSKELRKRAREEGNDSCNSEEENDHMSSNEKMIAHLEKEVNKSKRAHNEDHEKIEQLKGIISTMSAALKAPVPPPAATTDVVIPANTCGLIVYAALAATTELARTQQIADEMKRHLVRAREHIRELECPMCPVCHEPGASVLLHGPSGSGTAAKHLLCSRCLEQIVMTSAKPLCPLCKTPIVMATMDISAMQKAKPAVAPVIEPDRPSVEELRVDEFATAMKSFLRAFPFGDKPNLDKALKAAEQQYAAHIHPSAGASFALRNLPDIPARFAGVVPEADAYMSDDPQ
jgi:hypothetical protein